MSAWKKAMARRRRARSWDAPRPEGGTVADLKALFGAAREEAPAPDGALWEKLRPRLAAHDARARDPFSFIPALAATAPRLAVAALGILLLAAGLYWSRGAPFAPSPAAQRNPMAVLGDPLRMIGGGLEARTGQGLLRHIAYDAPEGTGR